jgi:aldehyde:ferredoxin oxidoreductase
VRVAGGYMGKYCIVDLGTGTTEMVEPGDRFYQKYLSGYGLGAAVITERQKAGIDPLSPESYLGFCSGLLTGTGAAFSGRCMVVGKSPLTGGWGDANVGGFLARELKRAGFDAVFFTGAAEMPVWVNITGDGIDIKDASSLWGKDIVETEEIVKKKLGDKNVQIASIGISGEKRSLISGIVTDNGRIAARSGLGALMGSKKLKAVSFRGKQDIPVADSDTVKGITKKFLEDYKKSHILDRLTVAMIHTISKIIARTGISFPTQPSLVREIWKRYGTSGVTVYSALVGDTPIKNWDGVGYLDYTFASAEKCSGENVIKHQKRRYACQGCPLACGRIIDINKGRFKGTEVHKPEYETLASFGGLLLQDDLDAIIEANELCNRAGIDTISTGGTLAFAIECFEHGIIDKNDTGGLALGWGKTNNIITLIEMMINREGFGDVLADGVRRAAERIGKGAEQYAVHAGGQELPMHDSRLDPGYAIAYECEPTPGRHTVSSYQNASLYGVKAMFPAARRMIKNAHGKTAKNVKLYTAGSFYMQLLNGSGMCLFGALTSRIPVVEYLNAATGWNMTADEYFKTGERILSMRKAFTVREGLRPIDCKLHERARGKVPLAKGPLKGITVDVDFLRKEFFDTVGWDPDTGGPTKKKLKELGIAFLFL